MLTPCKRLLFLALFVIGIALYVGCDQPEDILTPTSQSKLYLNEERLPNNPDSLIYELWAANSTDTVSMGKFGYNHATRKYFDGNMELRADSNEFYIADDVNNYEVLFVSVETVPDNDAASPGPIMLLDFTASPTIKMTFPQVDSIWSSTVRYNMETTSDRNRNPLTDGYGIWFSNYIEESRDLNDTNAILDWEVVTLTMETLFVKDTNIIAIDTNSIVVKDTTLIFGLDTVSQRVVRFDVIERIDSVPPYPKTLLSIDWDVSYGSITYDVFTQDNFAFPDISQYGWKYKGWVVSDVIDASAVGKMTKPAWILSDGEMENTDGGLLTTGTFDRIDAPDDANPYVESDRVPPFPGEEFLQNLPAGISGPVELVPGGGCIGKVFVTVEPINFNTDTTNFPLIAFMGDLPSSRTEVEDVEQQFTLKGWMFSNDPYRGFPLITVTKVRY